MKELDHILTLQETEQLCRLYMECRLSVLEEAELEYILGKLPYSSPVIDDARTLMAVGTMALGGGKKRGLRMRTVARWVSGVAAAAALVFAVSLFIGHPSEGMQDPGTAVMAYESGRRLDAEEAEQSVHDAMAKAEALMAKADRQEKSALEKATYYMNLDSERK